MTNTEKIKLAEDLYNDPSTTQKEKALLKKLFPEIKPMYFLEIPAGDVAPAEEDGPLEDIFPESSESEDERIRKAIIKAIEEAFAEQGIAGGDLINIDGFNMQEMVAYLEKQKEQIPYIDFVIKPHKGDDANPYDMSVFEAQEYAIKRGFGIPFNDGEVYVDERHITQTIGNILRWADEHPKEQKPSEEQIDAMKYTLDNGGFYKLKAEIEKRLKNIHDYINGAGMKYKGPKFYKAQGKESAYDALLSIIYSLQQKQQEPSNNLVDVDAVREDFIMQVYRVLDADPTNDRANAIIDAFDSLPTVSQIQPEVDLAEESYMRGYARGAKEERDGLSPTMLTYAADVFGGKMLPEDISYSYRQELADYFRNLAKMAKATNARKEK